MGRRRLVLGCALLACRAGAATVGPLVAGTELPLAAAVAPAGNAGISVTIAGDTAVVGAMLDDGGYVFGRDGTTWDEQAKIVATDAAAGDYFGTAAAIAAGTAIVGAPHHGTAGIAYAYDLVPGENVGGALSIRNAAPDDPTRTSVRFRGRASPAVAAAPGSPADPRCGAGDGGSIEVRSTTSGQSFAQPLPCAGWRPIGGAASPRGYQYLDPARAAGPCRRVLASGAKVQAYCGGRAGSPLAYDLQAGRSEVPVTVRVEVGAETYCARFGGVVPRDGSSGRTFAAHDPATTTACE